MTKMLFGAVSIHVVCRAWSLFSVILVFLCLLTTCGSTSFANDLTTELQKVVASDGGTGDSFGGAVAVGDDTAVIAAIGNNEARGAAYVFVRSGDSWIFQAKLSALDANVSDNCGVSVAIQADSVFVGCPAKQAVYVFTRNGSTWSQSAKLTADNGVAFGFGQSIALSSNEMIIGAPNEGLGGSAYIFVFNGSNWIQQSRLLASDAGDNDQFGKSVAIENDLAIVGSFLDDIGSNVNQGSVYIFARQGTAWNENAKLLAPDGRASARFGTSVAIADKSVVVGAATDNVASHFSQGSVYVFVRPLTAWTLQAKLTASDGAAGDGFGTCIALEGTMLLIQAPGHDTNGQTDRGVVYVFFGNGDSWIESNQLAASDGSANEGFGFVAVNHGTILVGIPSDKIGSIVNQGSAYFFGLITSAPDLLSSSDTGVSNTDNVTSSRQPVFSVAGLTAGASYEFYRDSVLLASGPVTLSSAQFTDPMAPANGTFQYKIRQVQNGRFGSFSPTFVTIDNTVPVLTIDKAPSQNDPTSSAFVDFSFSFSENIPGFNSSGVSLAGSTANTSNSILTITNTGLFYDVRVDQISSDGTIVANVLPNTLTDTAGNALSVTVIDNSITRDTIGPSVTIDQAPDQPDPTAQTPIQFVVVFSEPVTDFDYQDVVISDSSASVIGGPLNIDVSGSGNTYIVKLKAVTSNGQFVKVRVRQGAVQDLAGNPSLASTSTDNIVVVDNVRPTVSVDQASGQSDPTARQPINFKIVFSENVVDFNDAFLSFSGSTANMSRVRTQITGADGTYNVAVSNILSPGIVRLNIPAGGAHDTLGNPNFASTSSDNSVSIGAINGIHSDFDGDGKTDLSAFRPSDGNWYAYRSDGGGAIVRNWGIAGDILTPGDYDGDGKTDPAAYRPSTGQWLIFRSSDSTVNILNFGIAGDRPVAGDYDGDGKTDVAQFRPSEGVWYVFRSSDNGVSITTWGEATDLTVPADYDGDGKTDVAVFRPSTGVWYVFRSTAGPMVVGWGVAGDKPVETDYDGDGKDDVAIYRPSEGNWYVFRSFDNSVQIVNWGNATDVPSPGDYDGDGKDDFAVFRDGTWFAYESTAGPVVSNWGAAGDTSIPSRYIP